MYINLKGLIAFNSVLLADFGMIVSSLIAFVDEPDVMLSVKLERAIDKTESATTGFLHLRLRKAIETMYCNAIYSNESLIYNPPI